MLREAGIGRAFVRADHFGRRSYIIVNPLAARSRFYNSKR
jgi:hypothetical protein